MPLVRIAVPKGKGSMFKRAVGDAIHEAMVATIDVPTDDRFLIISEHGPDELIYDRNYLNVDRSDQAIFVHFTMKRGRTPTKKRALFRRIADNLSKNPGIRPQDVMIVLSENELVDWSFGNGEAQIAKDRG